MAGTYMRKIEQANGAIEGTWAGHTGTDRYLGNHSRLIASAATGMERIRLYTFSNGLSRIGIIDTDGAIYETGCERDSELPMATKDQFDRCFGHYAQERRDHLLSLGATCP